MYIPTREVIKTALVELLQDNNMDAITVKMVCQRAGVSRQALYNHYYCLLDVLQEVLMDEMNAAVKDLGVYQTWAMGFRAILDNLLQGRVLLLHVYRSSYRRELMEMLEGYGARLVKKGISDCARDMGYEVEEQDRTFMLELYMSTFMGVIDRWLKDNMRLSPEYIAGRCDAMMGFSIRNTLKKLCGAETDGRAARPDIQAAVWDDS